jgi:hypothetical protein
MLMTEWNLDDALAVRFEEGTYQTFTSPGACITTSSPNGSMR